MYYILYTCTVDAAVEGLCDDDATAAYCLLLPGKVLYLSPLLGQKKFRKRGNKNGAVRAFYQLEDEGLGKVLEVGCTKGTSVVMTFFVCERHCVIQ